MTKNKIVILVLVILLFVLAFLGWRYFFTNSKQAKQGQTTDLHSLEISTASLEQLKKDYPQLVSFVDDIKAEAEKVQVAPNEIVNYFDLGLAWKSLADRTKNKEHYRSALLVYEAGIKKTAGKNTIFFNNAGHMAEYLEDYNLAEQYYRQAINVDSGDFNNYVNLIELYQYKLKKSKPEIMAVFDEALAKVITNRSDVLKFKEIFERETSQ